MFKVKQKLRNFKNAILNVPEVEAKVREATTTDPWMASSTLLNDIAQASFDREEFHVVMDTLWSRMNESGKNWRIVYKSLNVLEHLIFNGPERTAEHCRSHVFRIRTLQDFQYVNDKGKDEGLNVREKAKKLVKLVQSEDLVREGREKASENRGKYKGISSDDWSRSSSYQRRSSPPRRRSSRHRPPTPSESSSNSEDDEEEIQSSSRKEEKPVAPARDPIDSLLDFDTPSSGNAMGGGGGGAFFANNFDSFNVPPAQTAPQMSFPPQQPVGGGDAFDSFMDSRHKETSTAPVGTFGTSDWNVQSSPKQEEDSFGEFQKSRVSPQQSKPSEVKSKDDISAIVDLDHLVVSKKAEVHKTPIEKKSMRQMKAASGHTRVQSQPNTLQPQMSFGAPVAPPMGMPPGQMGYPMYMGRGAPQPMYGYPMNPQQKPF